MKSPHALRTTHNFARISHNKSQAHAPERLVRRGKDDGRGRFVGVGDPRLGPGQNIGVVTVGDGRHGGRAGVRAVARFAQTEAADHEIVFAFVRRLGNAPGVGGDPLALLLLVAELGERVQVERIVRAHNDADRRAAAGYFLHGDRVAHGVELRSAVLALRVDAHEAQFGLPRGYVCMYIRIYPQQHWDDVRKEK